MSQLYHRRKHKMKHKKKHKEERKHKNQQPDCLNSGEVMDVPPPVLSEHEEHEAYTAIKEQCLKQKLSISLKRLNTNAYAPSYPVSNASSGCKSPEASSDGEEHEEEEEGNAETAPDFPAPEHPLVMRLSASATSVEGCLSANGRRMDVGDVVWGKVHGFPWWPGKVSFTSLLFDPLTACHTDFFFYFFFQRKCKCVMNYVLRIIFSFE